MGWDGDGCLPGLNEEQNNAPSDLCSFFTLREKVKSVEAQQVLVGSWGPVRSLVVLLVLVPPKTPVPVWISRHRPALLVGACGDFPLERMR